ncbi:MAG: hypothetical protein ABSE41_13925, partial [Bacteroidota bacterium]
SLSHLLPDGLVIDEPGRQLLYLHSISFNLYAAFRERSEKFLERHTYLGRNNSSCCNSVSRKELSDD